MLSIVDINLLKMDGISLKGSVVALGSVGRGSITPTGSIPSVELAVPWQKDLQQHPQFFSLLNWRSAVSEFKGRDREWQALLNWISSRPDVSIKFVNGEGGVGKSRFAAEFATELQKQKWSAGFVDLRRPLNFRLNKNGTLLVIDYPEEDKEAVGELLDDLEFIKKGIRLRVLFLTRRRIEDWLELFEDSHIAGRADMIPVTLSPIQGSDAHKIFCSFQERAAEIQDSCPLPLSEKALERWFGLSPENQRPLFIVALALHSALHPEDQAVRYTSKEVVQGLVERELERLRRTARNKGLADDYLFARVLALATISDSLHVTQLTKIINEFSPLLPFPEKIDTEQLLDDTGLLYDRKIPAVKPDILGAAFVVKVLGKRPETAPELVWTSLGPDFRKGMEVLARLVHDAETTLGILDYHIGDWLAEGAKNNPLRCEALDDVFTNYPLPLGWREAAIIARKALLERVKGDNALTAKALNNLSKDLAAVGDTGGALKAAQEAVEIRRYRSEISQEGYESALAVSLNTLSNRLAAVGDASGALKAIQEAVDIRRRLVKANTERYEPALAGNLNNLSGCLAAVGDASGALKAIQEAVDSYRRLSKTNPALYEPDLPMSLNNLSSRLSAMGDVIGALEAIKEAVDIRRRLVKANRALYEPSLALNLNNLSRHMEAIGDTDGALKAIKEAVEIRRRLAKVNPKRYGHNLAVSLNNFSSCLAAVGDAGGALKAIQEAVEIRRRLTKETPARYEPDLAVSLNNFSSCLAAVGDAGGALKAIQEAVEIRRRLTKEIPARYQPDLAESLNSLSNCLAAVGDMEGALRSANESIDFYRRLAQAIPARFEPDLAKSLQTLGRINLLCGRRAASVKAFKEGVDLIRPYSVTLPGSPFQALLKALEEDLKRT